MRVVIDTNVIVSAYLGGSLEIILTGFKERKFDLIVSKSIADEYFKVLRRPKFKIELDEFNGDGHLLEIKTFRGIQILTVREFIGQFLR